MKKDLVRGICSNRMTRVRESSLICSVGELNLFQVPSYRPTADEWPLHEVDMERERLLKGLDTLMQIDVAEQFRAPGN